MRLEARAVVCRSYDIAHRSSKRTILIALVTETRYVGEAELVIVILRAKLPSRSSPSVYLSLAKDHVGGEELDRKRRP